MNWDDPAAWLNYGEDFDPTKADEYGIKVVYIDPRPENPTSTTSRTAVRIHQLLAGAYIASSWYAGAGAGFGKYASDLANAFIPRGSMREAPPLMLDIEAKPKQWIADAIVTYRHYQPQRPTSITTEGFQGDGRILPLTEMAAAKLRWLPQTYAGDMSDLDAAAVMVDACRAYNPAWVYPFYAAERYWGARRGGCVFTLERLP